MTAANVIVLWIQAQTEKKDITGNLPVHPVLSERKEWRRESERHSMVESRDQTLIHPLEQNHFLTVRVLSVMSYE